MRNSLDLEAGNRTQTSHDQAFVVYGYPVHSDAYRPGHLLWTRTSSSTSSSSDAAVAPSANHRAKNSLLWMILPTLTISLLAVLIWHEIGYVINTRNFPKFEVDSISYSLLNNETRSSNWAIGVSVRNTNSRTLMAFDDFQVSVYYKAEKLSSAAVSAMYLGPKNRTSVVASLQSQSLEDKTLTAAEIAEDRRRGSLKFDVVLQVKMTYLFTFPSIIRGKKRDGNSELLCSDVRVGFPSDATEQGTMLGGPYRCDSHLVLRLGS